MKDPHDDGPRARLLEIGTCRSVARADRLVTLGFRLISVNTAVRTREQPRRTGAGTAPRRNVDRRSGGATWVLPLGAGQRTAGDLGPPR